MLASGISITAPVWVMSCMIVPSDGDVVVCGRLGNCAEGTAAGMAAGKVAGGRAAEGKAGDIPIGETGKLTGAGETGKAVGAAAGETGNAVGKVEGGTCCAPGIIGRLEPAGAVAVASLGSGGNPVTGALCANADHAMELTISIPSIDCACLRCMPILWCRR